MGKREYLKGLAIEFIEVNTLDVALLNKIVPGHDAIVHLDRHSRASYEISK
jgi:hypothetical protein